MPQPRLSDEAVWALQAEAEQLRLLVAEIAKRLPVTT